MYEFIESSITVESVVLHAFIFTSRKMVYLPVFHKYYLSGVCYLIMIFEMERDGEHEPGKKMLIEVICRNFIEKYQELDFGIFFVLNQGIEFFLIFCFFFLIRVLLGLLKKRKKRTARLYYFNLSFTIT